MTKHEALTLALEILKAAYVPADLDEQREKAITELEALAQPEQEPVEWGVDWGPNGNSVSIIKRLAGGGIEVVGWEYAPHPPQRTWVELTDEERDECDWGQGERDYGRIIEAKLKEKNT